ncbi:MAG: hypothetical protein JRJ56_01020 [Deltaproteobacteria bacterium]|nr:hypothetical protein [Deltaproteobacteria bacterium]
MLLLACLAAVWCWRQAVRRPGTGREKREGATVARPVTAARRRVKNSCLANDPRLTQQAILAWAATAWPENPPTNLQKLAAELRNAGLVAAFADLEKLLYGPSPAENWDGRRFWRLLAGNLKKPNSERKSGANPGELPPLYGAG